MFLFQLQICGSSSACRKKTRCRWMASVPPFWDICQWQNFPGDLNTWPNTSSKRFFLLPFLQPKKNVQKSMLLHWCCPLKIYSRLVTLEKKVKYTFDVFNWSCKKVKKNRFTFIYSNYHFWFPILSWQKMSPQSQHDLSLLSEWICKIKEKNKS